MTSWAGILLATFGAFEAPFPSAEEVGKGGCQPSMRSLAGADEGNPAFAASVEGWSAGTGWTRPLGLDGLDLWGAWARIPLPFDGGLDARWKSLTADPVYREDQIALDVGTLWNQVTAGFGLRAGRVEVGGLVLGHPVGWAAGGIWAPVPGVQAGVSWEDPSGIDPSGIRTPWEVRIGGGCRSNDSGWAFQVGASKLQETAWRWSLGQEWKWRPLRFRIGLRSDPLVLCLGLGVELGRIRIDWATETETRFGWQQHAGISWSE